MKFKDLITFGAKELLEALKPSQYRQYVKGWDKTKYEDMFRKYTDDRKGYRIYIPLKGEPKKVDPDPEVEHAVKAAGYEIEDYLAGIASKDEGKRKIKIGKLLKDPKLQQKFANDPARAASKKSEYFVVISRHPYDLAGMSTDRGWKSCMNLHDGVNRHFVDLDVKEGTLIAYCVRVDDKNINNPVCRLLIKPFINIETTEKSDDKIAFGIENRIYGTEVPGFIKTVEEWVNEVNSSKKLDGLFQMNDRLYKDSQNAREIKAFGDSNDKKLIAQALSNPSILRSVDSSEAVQLAVISQKPQAIMYIKNPTDKAIVLALEKDAYSYHYLITHGNQTSVSQDLIKKAFEKNKALIKYIVNPSVKEQEEALAYNSNYMQWIHNPNLELLERYILKEPNNLQYYPVKQSNELHDQLIKKCISADMNYPYWVQYLKNLKPDNIRRILEINPSLIQYLKFSDSKQVKKVVSEFAEAIIKKDPSFMKQIPKKYVSEDTQKQAVTRNPKVITAINDDIRDEILKKHPEYVRYFNTDRSQISNSVSNTGVHVMDIAIHADPNAIQYCKCPDNDLQYWAMRNGADPEHLLKLKTKYLGIHAVAEALKKKPDLKDEFIARFKKSRMSYKMEQVEEILAKDK